MQHREPVWTTRYQGNTAFSSCSFRLVFVVTEEGEGEGEQRVFFAGCSNQTAADQRVHLAPSPPLPPSLC
jgi:hypothetical protein